MTRSNAILVSFPRGILQRLDSLVTKGMFSKRQDAIREAVRRFVQEQEEPQA